MKAKFILPFFLFFASVSYAQNITFSELFSMCNKPSWDKVNENLLKKGWDYYNSSKGDDTHYSTIIWSFNKNAYSDKAQGWLHLYTYEDQPNKITYSFFNKTSYNTIKGGITA